MISTTPPREGLPALASRALGQWRLILVWLVCTIVPTLIATYPLSRALSAELDHSVYAPRIADSLDLAVMFELPIDMREMIPVLSNVAIAAFVLLLLIMPFLSGMIIVAAKMRRPAGFLTLLQGSIPEYWRMLRMLIWSIVPLSVAAGIGVGLLAWVSQRGESAILESEVKLEHGLAMIVLAVLVVLVHATIEAGRAQFVIDGTRRSAIRAWWRGVRSIAAHPLSTLLPYIVLTVVGLAVVFLFAVIRINLAHAEVGGWLLALLFTELISATLIWLRVARLFSLVQSARPLDAEVPSAGHTRH